MAQTENLKKNKKCNSKYDKTSDFTTEPTILNFVGYYYTFLIILFFFTVSKLTDKYFVIDSP